WVLRPFYEWILANMAMLALSAIVIGIPAYLLANAVRDRQPWALRAAAGLGVAMVLMAVIGIGTLPLLAKGVTVQAATGDSAFVIPDSVDLPVATDGTTKVVSDIDVDGGDVDVTVTVNRTTAMINGAPVAENAPTYT